VQVGVGVDTDDDVVADVFEAFIEGVGLAPMVCLDNLEVWVAQGCQYLPGGVGRAVVDDHDLYFGRVILSPYSSKGLGDIVRFVVGCNEEAYGRQRLILREWGRCVEKHAGQDMRVEKAGDQGDKSDNEDRWHPAYDQGQILEPGLGEIQGEKEPEDRHRGGNDKFQLYRDVVPFSRGTGSGGLVLSLGWLLIDQSESFASCTGEKRSVVLRRLA